MLSFTYKVKEVIKVTQGERLKYLRKTLNLTLEKFGEKIGLKKNSMSAIETGRNNLTESVAKSICREFNVDYFWLTEGEGEMFINIPDTIIEEMKIAYNLSDFEEKILKQYLILTEDERSVLQDILKKMFHIDEKNEGS